MIDTPMRNLIYSGIGLSIIAFLCFLESGCNKPEAVSENKTPTHQVDTYTLSPYTGKQQYDYPGTIQPRSIHALGFRVPGRMTERHYEIGMIVNPHTLLAKIDPHPYELQYHAAQSQQDAAIYARQQAETLFKRAQQLHAQHYISDTAFEDFYTKAQLSQQNYASATAQRNLAQENLSDTQLFSPVNGVVMTVQADAGQVVAAGQPVVTIADQHHPDVVFSLPENMIARVNKGQYITFSLMQHPGQPYTARITDLARVADPYSRTYTVRAQIDKPTDVLRFGMSTTVSLHLKNPQQKGNIGYAVPFSAVGVADNIYYVYRLSQSRCARTAVDVYGTTADHYLIHSAQLHPQDLIVQKGLPLLHDAEIVTVRHPEAKAVSS